jgi:poly(A) polymerase
MRPDDALSELLAEPVVRAIAAAAGDVPCHLVGGVVRDRLAGVHTYDFDVSLSSGAVGIGEELADRLRARLVRLGGDRFAAVRIVGKDLQVDLWDREGGSLADDLERRDFTINSIALGLDGKVVDPLGGRDDVARRRLRANRQSSFAEDPLRVVRLVRFAAVGYRVDRRTGALARRSAPEVQKVAAERIRQELGLTLAAPHGAAAVHWLVTTTLYPALWSGEPVAGEESSARASIGLAARALERRLAGLESSPGQRALARQALLVAALATPGRTAAALTAGMHRRGLLSGREREAIARQAAPRPLPRTDLERRRFLHDAGPDWRLALVVRAALARRPESAAWDRVAPRLEEIARAEPEIFDPPALLDGHEIQQLTGLKPGSELGRRIAELRTAQVLGQVRTRQQAIAFVRAEPRA